MSQLRPTPSQTVGPFFAYGLTARQYGYDYTSLLHEHLLSPDLNPAEQIRITGRIYDGAGNAVNDALIELWQAGPRQGEHHTLTQYPSAPLTYPNQPGTFWGYGRLGTGTTVDNSFTFTTVKPGVARPGEAPHINVILLMRGSLRTLYTRLYFSDEAQDNAQDPLLTLVPDERKTTLIAQQTSTGQYQFDIRLQGESETVFFDM